MPVALSAVNGWAVSRGECEPDFPALWHFCHSPVAAQGRRCRGMATDSGAASAWESGLASSAMAISMTGPPAAAASAGVMGHQQGRQPAAAGVIEHGAAEAVPQAQVEPAERLVQQQGPRLRQQRAQERDAGALSARERRRIAIAEAGQAGLEQGGRRPGRGARAVRPPRPAGRRRDSRPPSCAGTADRPGTGCRSGGARAAGRRSRRRRGAPGRRP